MMDETSHRNHDDPIATLLRLAGRRPGVSDEVTDRVRSAVREEWLHQVRTRSRHRWLATAAAVVALTAAGIMTLRTTNHPTTRQTQVSPAIVATIQSVNGGAIRGDRKTTVLLDEGAHAYTGDTIETAVGGTTALTWSSATLRLDGGTRLRLQTAHRLFLERGAVYIASGNVPPHAVVLTPLGSVEDAGTQFEVRVTPDRVRIRVREGRVNLERDGARHSAVATPSTGIELDDDASGTITQHSIARSGAEWEWVVRAAPPIRLEGRTLRDVVDAVGHERGVAVDYSGDLARTSSSIQLHGAVLLTPDEALAAALASAGLSARTEGDRLIVRRKH
jgi:ferric-dicitrate binding protein FerR (iron transport regulator)